MSDAEVAASTMRRIRLLMQQRDNAERRQDFRAGVIAATVANAMSGGKKGGGGFTPADFFPGLGSRTPEKSVEEMEAEAIAWAARWNRSHP